MSLTGKKGDPSGFTLIEIFIVLMAIVILAAAVVPSMRGLGRQGDLDDAAVRVAACARYARETAAARGVTIDLTVETAPALIRLAVEQNGNASGSQGMAGLGSGEASAPIVLPARFAQVLLPDRVTARLDPAPDDSPNATTGAGNSSNPLYAPADALRFSPDQPCKGAMIVLSDARGRERRVLVKPRTGEVNTEASGVQ